MSNTFKKFLKDEVDAILSSMDEKSRKDPGRCSAKALAWIEKHAAKFRRDWKGTSQRSRLSRIGKVR